MYVPSNQQQCKTRNTLRMAGIATTSCVRHRRTRSSTRASMCDVIAAPTLVAHARGLGVEVTGAQQRRILCSFYRRCNRSRSRSRRHRPHCRLVAPTSTRPRLQFYQSAWACPKHLFGLDRSPRLYPSDHVGMITMHQRWELALGPLPYCQGRRLSTARFRLGCGEVCPGTAIVVEPSVSRYAGGKPGLVPRREERLASRDRCNYQGVL